MHLPSVKKILLIVFVIILLIAIPLTIYLISTQQKSTETATPSSSLTFTPGSQSANVGEEVNFDINLDPGSNSVSLARVLITYDATKLATDGAGFVANAASFPSIISGPTYGAGTVSFTLSIGANAPPVEKTTKLGTLTFKTLEPTDSAATQLTFGNETQILTASGGNEFNQNVLSTTTPASLNILGQVPTPTVEIIPTAEPVDQSLLTPTPITASQSIDTSTNQITTTQETVVTGPICLSFTADRPTTGVVPFNVNFTLVATDSAATITKATFNFGDGQVKDLTQPGEIDPHTVNALTMHVYNTTGTFTAFGSITDSDGNVSSTGNCSITVIVGETQPTVTGTSSESAQITPIISPLPPSGPANLITIGLIGLILIIVGAALIFAL